MNFDISDYRGGKWPGYIQNKQLNMSHNSKCSTNYTGRPLGFTDRQLPDLNYLHQGGDVFAPVYFLVGLFVCEKDYTYKLNKLLWNLEDGCGMSKGRTHHIWVHI